MDVHENLIHKIALGTVQFGLNYGISNNLGKTPSKEVTELLIYCKDAGINYLDTAFGYGESEQVLGNNCLRSFRIISKFLPETDSKYDLENQFKLSLERLKVKSLFAYIAHRPAQVSKSNWELLTNYKQQGKVNKIGFSFNEPYEVDMILDKGFIPDIVQAPFNYFDNRFVEKLGYLKEQYKTEIHTRSTFLQGLFFMNPNDLPDFFNPVKEDIENVHKNKYVAGFLLNYSLSQTFIDKVVIGVNNKQQLIQNIAEINKYNNIAYNYKQYPNEILNPSKWPSKQIN
jgi:aryl-alcohol dehydrogenase-like predicted oxidoreductase